ncbi:MAG: hypothetical protein EA412_13305 [Chitinophagaceae bacterium]|nr:MAG: hypothetical protein EA412_13305 [Chitinophagaceae bacterium]
MNKTHFLKIFLLAIVVMIAACKKDDPEDPNGGGNGESVEITAETVELSGPMHGTLLSGRTYKLTGDLIVEAGREIVMEEGVRIESTAGGEAGNEAFSFIIYGSFYSLGTEQNPNWITTVPDNRTMQNWNQGYIGGFIGLAGAENIVIKWTHMEYFGGRMRGQSTVFDEGETIYGFYTEDESTVLIIEDSWLRFFLDDAIRPEGGKIAILRNTFEGIGGVEGEALNAKSGTVGVFAYNMIIGLATNGPKTGSGGGLPTQSIIDVYNNTIVGGGYRRVAPGRGGSMNVENGAGGYWYNNVVVNCRYGMRVVNDADYSKTFIGHTHYYGNGTFDDNEGPLSDNFYPENGTIGGDFPQSHIVNDNLNNEDPLFMNHDVDQFSQSDYRNVHENSAITPYELNLVWGQDFRLQSNSPLIGAGNASAFTPTASLTEIGPKALSYPIPAPSADIGAYPTGGFNNGIGNRHTTHNYYPN